MAALKKVLDSIDIAIQHNRTLTLVFDLDSTLFCVSPRTQFIMRQFPETELGLSFKSFHEEALGKLNNIEALPTDWGMKSALVRHQVFAQIDFFEALRHHWILNFFSNDLLIHDIAYDGAIEFVKEAHQRGAQIRYLTGRDAPRMGPGSIKQLKAHGLPLEEESHLQMKPDAGEPDTEYKASYFKDMTPEQLQNTWFFENEPWILNAVATQYPDLNIVFSDTVHSGREQPNPNWLRVGFDWTEEMS